MKRFASLILALCLILLCGCGAKAPALPEKQFETPAPASEETAAARPGPAEAPELAQLLTEIRERMHPGTAGSSLTAQQLAAQLLDWSMQTDMDEAQIRAAVDEFLKPLGHLERTEFALQMASVSGAVDLLLGENSEALMDDIGGTEGTLWPWADAPAEKLEALFSASDAKSALIVPDPS